MVEGEDGGGGGGRKKTQKNKKNLEPQLSMRTLTFVRRKAPLARKPYVKVYVERHREGSQGNADSRVT